MDVREKNLRRPQRVRFPLKIEIAGFAELSWINKYYEEISFKLTSPTDFQVYVTMNGKVAGLGRIVHVDELNGELGGIYVLPEFRGQKIAEEVVSSLLSHNTYPTLWCIPFQPLEKFYRKFHFGDAGNVVIPEGVREKFAWCKGRYPDPAILLVKRTRFL